MGISMGSSEGAGPCRSFADFTIPSHDSMMLLPGYANADGNLMGWISECAAQSIPLVLQHAWGGLFGRLCYCRLDLNPKAGISSRTKQVPLNWNGQAPTDPWSKGAHRHISDLEPIPDVGSERHVQMCDASRGLSHMYLGQRGTTKLAAKGGVDVPANYKPLTLHL